MSAISDSFWLSIGSDRFPSHSTIALNSSIALNRLNGSAQRRQALALQLCQPLRDCSAEPIQVEGRRHEEVQELWILPKTLSKEIPRVERQQKSRAQLIVLEQAPIQ